MSINEVNFRDIKFDRNTKVDYGKGNPIINTIFAQFDKDHNGVFNDEEYSDYEKYLDLKHKRQEEIGKIKVNNSVVGHYDNKILKVQQKIERLSLEMKDIDTEAFNKLIEFEKAHPDIGRYGYTDKKDIPEGAVEYDISAFQMGIYDSKKDAFTGECYTKGYLTGLDKLTEEEKKEYLSLLDIASNSCKKLTEYQNKFDKLEKELDKYFGLKDMAQNGILNAVGTEDAENQAYQQYVQIRNDSNPFYKQIQELERKYQELNLKGSKTDEDNRQLEQYRIQIEQLEQASQSWSLSDMNEKAQVQLNQGQGFNIENLSEQAVYSSQNETISNTHSLGLGYSNTNWNASLNFTETDRYKLDGDTEHSFNIDQNVRYARQKFSFSESSSLNIEPNSLYFNQRLGAQYGRYELNVSETVNRMSFDMPDEQGNMQEQTTVTSTTSVGASLRTGKFTNTASVQFAPEGTSYSLGTNANYGFRANKFNFDLNPAMNVSYNQETESTRLNPSLNAMIMYNNGGFNGRMNIAENYNTTMRNGNHPFVNNDFSINTALSFKGFGAGFNFNDNDNPDSHSDSYGATVSYTHEKVGRFEVGYTYQTMHNKQGMNTHDNQVQFTYSAPLETINSWFKKK